MYVWGLSLWASLKINLNNTYDNHLSPFTHGPYTNAQKHTLISQHYLPLDGGTPETDILRCLNNTYFMNS